MVRFRSLGLVTTILLFTVHGALADPISVNHGKLTLGNQSVELYRVNTDDLRPMLSGKPGTEAELLAIDHARSINRWAVWSSIAAFGAVLGGSLAHQPIIAEAGIWGWGVLITTAEYYQESASRSALRAASLFNGEALDTYEASYTRPLHEPLKISATLGTGLNPYVYGIRTDLFLSERLGVNVGAQSTHRLIAVERVPSVSDDIQVGLTTRTVAPYPCWLSEKGYVSYNRLGFYVPTQKITPGSSGFGSFFETEAYFSKSPHWGIGVPVRFFYGPTTELNTRRESQDALGVMIGVSVSVL